MSIYTRLVPLLLALLLAACNPIAGEPPRSGEQMEIAADEMTNMDMTAGTMDADAVEPVISAAGLYRITARSRMDPVMINEIHEWTLQIETMDGDPVSGASISVSGGMPAHDHGLPTAPRVTDEIEPGLYLLEGVRFNMGGAWIMELEIEAPQGIDQAQLSFELK